MNNYFVFKFLYVKSILFLKIFNRFVYQICLICLICFKLTRKFFCYKTLIQRDCMLGIIILIFPLLYSQKIIYPKMSLSTFIDVIHY